jgi:signal transduction histidine kinase
MREKLAISAVVVLGLCNDLIADSGAESKAFEALDIMRLCACEILESVKLASHAYIVGQFDVLAHMLHDLLGPSATLLSYCDFVLEGFAGVISEEQKILLQAIHDTTHHLRLQLCNLVDYTRILALPRAEMMPFSLKRLLTPQIIRLAHSATLTWNIAADLPEVYSNRHYVGRSVVNLVANALQAAQDGLVRVTACVAAHRVHVRVTDNGCGITPATCQQLFEPFFQGRPTYDQLGLGLTVANEYIRLQGSTLHITSIENQGTTAEFSIPIARQR